MSDEILFTISKDNLETGLRGYPVGYCPTSYVHPEKGLYYSGIAVHDLAGYSLEEVIYLLIYGRRPTSDEKLQFSNDIKKRAYIEPSVCDQIRSLPKKGEPLKLFAGALLLDGMLNKTDSWWDDCLNIVAKAPLLAGLVMAHVSGWEETKDSSLSEDDYEDRMLAAMSLPFQVKAELKEALRLFLLLHFDHGGGNLSTFVGKAVASGLEDMYGSLASAMLALDGPRHGRANQDCLQQLQEIQEETGFTPTNEELKDYLIKRLNSGKLIYGFGHAVLRVQDPRATLLYEFVAHHFPKNPSVRLAIQLKDVGSALLKEMEKVHDPYPNVDAISGVMLSAAGFDFPQFLPLLFGAARCVGISRQILYERVEARNGKGTPIVRPQYLYLNDPTLSG